MNLQLPNRRGRCGIPEQVLERWAGKGADATAKRTHESIRAVIGKIPFAIGRRPSVYLQGSYRNGTNIRADSDVDIVVEFPYRRKRLGTECDETIDWFAHAQVILEALQRNYGERSVSVKAKCLSLESNRWRLSADVVIAFSHQQVFSNSFRLIKVDGIKFYNHTEGRWIVNFPKLHLQNGIRKNAPGQTNGWYKPTVRMFKNASGLAGLDVPSYFLECLLYNVPNNCFGLNHKSTFDRILNWLSGVNLEKFICQNHCGSLFGPMPEQWSLSEAYEFLSIMRAFRHEYE